MNNWLCMKGNVVVNIVVAEEKQMMTDQYIGKTYDSYINRDVLPIPRPNIGSYLDPKQGWITPLKDLQKKDFSGQDLTNGNFSYCDLTGCNFKGAIIDGCDFNWSPVNYSLVGAIWRKQQITQGPVEVKNPFYFLIITDLFTQYGCQTFSNDEWLKFSDADRSALDLSATDNDPNKVWQLTQPILMQQLQDWGVVVKPIPVPAPSVDPVPIK